MSLIGYRNLQWLKTRLLPAEMDMEATWDADVEAIGLGVAAAFDRFTGRTLRRTVAHRFETSADQSVVIADCYPIETVTAHVVVAGSASSIQIANTLTGCGIVRFYGAPGGEEDIIRLTITGGYFCEDDGVEQPAGSTALPDELLNAWVQQCRAVCEAENTFRGKAASSADKKTSSAVGIDALTLLSGVKAVLQLHTRQG